MTNWDWPQWLLASWWAFGFFAGMFLMLLDEKINHEKFATRQVSVVFLVFILYMGGFWS